jgi:hypothetical protein
VRQALEIRGEVRWGRLTVVDEGMALLGSQLLRHGLGIQRSGEGGLFWPTVGQRRLFRLGEVLLDACFVN